MSREFWQSAVQAVQSWATPAVPATPIGDPLQMPTNAEAAPVELEGETEAASGTEQAIQEAEVQEVEEVCQDCENKWLIIKIERNTKHEFGGRWDCTVGDLKMEIWDEEDSGSGSLVFECKTSERGGPANADFSYSENKAQGANYAYYNQYMIMPSENYGISAHSTTNYKTYRYNTAYLSKPRPGIAIYGSGSGAMNRRTGVLIHAGTNHRWSVGCVVLHADGAVRDGRYRFDQTSSVNTLLTFLRKIHEFTGQSTHPIGAKMRHVKLIITESF